MPYTVQQLRHLRGSFKRTRYICAFMAVLRLEPDGHGWRPNRPKRWYVVNRPSYSRLAWRNARLGDFRRHDEAIATARAAFRDWPEDRR